MSCGILSLRNVTSGDREPIKPEIWGFDLLAADINKDVDAVDGAFEEDDDDDEDEGTDGWYRLL